MQYVGLVAIAMIFQYMYFSFAVGSARGKYGIQAPATTGNEHFERILRVQLNTAEQLITVFPLLLLSTHFFDATIAAGLGVVFVIGRFIYSVQYIKDPATRTSGMLIGFAATLGLLGTALWGVFSSWVS